MIWETDLHLGRRRLVGEGLALFPGNRTCRIQQRVTCRARPQTALSVSVIYKERAGVSLLFFSFFLGGA